MFYAPCLPVIFFKSYHKAGLSLFVLAMPDCYSDAGLFWRCRAKTG